MKSDYDKYMEQIEMLKKLSQPEATMPQDVAVAQDIERPAEIVNEQSPMREVAAQVNEAKLEDVNEEALSPHQQPKEESKEDTILKKYRDIMSKYEDRVNAPDKGISISDALPDILAGTHNILDYAQGRPMGDIKLGSIDRAKKGRAAKKASDLSGMQNLQKMYKDYTGLKDKSGKGKIYQTRSGLVSMGEDGIPKQIYADPYMKQSSEVQKKSLGLRGEKFAHKKDEKEKEKFEKVVKEFNNDPVMRDSKKAIIAADKARSIIKDGGKMAPSVMGRLLARMAGEVGVMTDQDVASFRGSSQWSDSLERFFQKGISGTLTDTDKKEMLNMVDRMSAIEKQAVEGYADNIVSQYSQASDIDRDKLMSTILPKPAAEIYKRESDTVLMEAPNGVRRRVKKDMMQKYLDKGAVVVKD